MQSTAEIFLFIAIGLLFLLSIDTLLRFSVARAKPVKLAVKQGMSTKQILKLLAKRLG
jgi:hypothetical protein